MINKSAKNHNSPHKQPQKKMGYLFEIDFHPAKEKPQTTKEVHTDNYKDSTLFE